VINNCIALIAAILLYISILSSLSSKKTAWVFNAFIRGFFISLFFLVLSVTSEIFTTGFNFIPKILGPFSNISFLLGVVFFILGMKSTANYITTFERLEKEIELQNTKVCPNCGETVNKIAKACHFCGHRFKSKKKTT
jgi:hypothetical protein